MLFLEIVFQATSTYLHNIRLVFIRPISVY